MLTRQHPSTNQCEWACRVAGVSFIGIQSAFGLLEDLCLFEHIRGRTLSLPVSKMNPITVNWHVLETEQRYDQGKVPE